MEPEVLLAYERRAAEAERRLAKLEAQLANGLSLGDEEPAPSTSIQTGLTDVVTSLKTDNDKLRYRVMHLARALREADAARKAQAADSAKLKYQIQHLRQSLREADQRKSSEQ